MIKNYKLTTHGGFLENREPFIVADNEDLILSFDTTYCLDKAYIVLKNGTVTRKEKLNNPYAVARELLFAGTLQIEVDLIVGDTRVKRFVLEPLVIKELDGNLVGLPELEEVKQRDEARGEELKAIREELAKVRSEREEEQRNYKEAMERIEALEKHYDPLAM